MIELKERILIGPRWAKGAETTDEWTEVQETIVLLWLRTTSSFPKVKSVPTPHNCIFGLWRVCTFILEPSYKNCWGFCGKRKKDATLKDQTQLAMMSSDVEVVFSRPRARELAMSQILHQTR